MDGQLPRTRPLEVGDSGKPVDRTFSVIHVLGDSTFVAGFYWISKGDAKMETVIVDKYDTKNLIDGRLREGIDTEFKVVGTSDRIGRRVPLLEPVK